MTALFFVITPGTIKVSSPLARPLSSPALNESCVAFRTDTRVVSLISDHTSLGMLAGRSCYCYVDVSTIFWSSLTSHLTIVVVIGVGIGVISVMLVFCL